MLRIYSLRLFVYLLFCCIYMSSCKDDLPEKNTDLENTFPTSRNKFLWPFSKNSIWNTPIGSDAVYVPADFGAIGLVYADAEYIYQSKNSDPIQPVYLPAGWVPRVPDTETPSFISIHLANDFIIPDATLEPYYTPNNATAVIEPDSVTYYELEPFTRPVAGGNVYSYNASRDGATTQNIKDDGRWGAHFGSGLSTLGGSIRAGEITGNTPIRHAIKIEFDAQQLWRNTIDPHQSYRYPADNTDSNTDGYGVYNTSNPALCMGSLLAIPPSISLESLNLKTCQAKKIFFALQNYGAYIVDTTGDGYKPNGGYSVTICAEKSVIDSEFSFEGSATLNADWFNDFKQLLKSIKVVDSNTQHSIGGGGTPRQPLAPPFNN